MILRWPPLLSFDVAALLCRLFVPQMILMSRLYWGDMNKLSGHFAEKCRGALFILDGNLSILRKDSLSALSIEQ